MDQPDIRGLVTNRTLIRRGLALSTGGRTAPRRRRIGRSRIPGSARRLRFQSSLAPEDVLVLRHASNLGLAIRFSPHLPS